MSGLAAVIGYGGNLQKSSRRGKGRRGNTWRRKENLVVE